MFSKSRSRKRPTVVLVVVASLICLLLAQFVKIIQRLFFAFADPRWPCIKVKVIEMSMSTYAMHRSTVMLSLNGIAF